MLVRAVPASVGCGALVATTSVSAEAASPIQLGRIYDNSPGTDRATNLSVNGEYVAIKNGGTTARSLTGWTVHDAQSLVYKFGTFTFTLGAGKTFVLRSGNGLNTRTIRYWGLGYHVWNNTGDKAVLRHAAGTAIDSCAWAPTASATRTAEDIE